MSAWEMVRKYAAFYYGEKSRENVVETVRLMEENMSHSADVVQGPETYCAYFTDKVDPEKKWTFHYAAKKLDQTRAEHALQLVHETENFMTSGQKSSWRWRIFRLRAEIDYALAKENDPELAMQELFRIYHCGENTLPCLLPPARTLWEKIIDERRCSLV